MKKQIGFTIIELLVVISIIGVVSTATVIPITGALAQAADTRRITDIRGTGQSFEYDRGFDAEYQHSAEAPTSIGSFISNVPKNNSANDGTYGWFSNVATREIFCVWTTLEKGNDDGDMYYVANRFGAGYSDTEPTSIVDCDFYKKKQTANSGHEIDDNDQVNDDVIADPNKDKVAMCHKPGNKEKTKLIKRSAMNSHLNHGDCIGACL